MTERVSPSRKRQRCDPAPADTLQHPSKQNRSKPDEACPPNYPTWLPAAFWDGLSEIPLTRNALHELDRRHRDCDRAARAARAAQRPAQTRNRRSLRPRIPWQRAAAARGDERPHFAASCPPADRQKIQRFARHGGPALADLRGYREPDDASADSMSSSQPSLGRRKRGSAPSSKRTGQDTTTTKTTGPYDRAFQQHLTDFGIFVDRYRYPDGRAPPQPENIQEIRRALAASRRSLSPSRFSDDDVDKFQQADADAAKERQVTASVFPIIEGGVEDGKCVSGEIPFTNLGHLTDGTLVPGNPDRYYGARPEQLDRRVRAQLGRDIVPSTQHDLPVVPNFFVAFKGPNGLSAVAQRQVCYDGALGARAMQSLRSYGAAEEAEAAYDGKAYAMMCSYHAGQLKLYTSHPLPPASPGARPEYVMTQVKAYAMTSDGDTFRQGAAAFRNARDWAKVQRDRAIEQANKRVHDEGGVGIGGYGSLPGSAATADGDTAAPRVRGSDAALTVYDSDTSADELSTGAPPAKRAQGPLRGPRRTQSGAPDLSAASNATTGPSQSLSSQRLALKDAGTNSGDALEQDSQRVAAG